VVKIRCTFTKSKFDFIKTNCDGAFSQEDLSGGWGYVMRGADGTVVCSGYDKHKLGKVLEAAHTEIIACLQSLQRAVMLGIQKVVLETDALMVAQAANVPVLDRLG